MRVNGIFVSCHIGQDNLRTDMIIKYVYGIGSAHNRDMYKYLMFLCSSWFCFVLPCSPPLNMCAWWIPFKSMFGQLGLVRRNLGLVSMYVVVRWRGFRLEKALGFCLQLDLFAGPSNFLVFKSLGLQFLQNFKLFPVGLSCCGSKWVKGKGGVIRKHRPQTGKTGRQNTS